jgi:hypothetical protein
MLDTITHVMMVVRVMLTQKAKETMRLDKDGGVMANKGLACGISAWSYGGIMRPKFYVWLFLLWALVWM